jgi:hypothetical protein
MLDQPEDTSQVANIERRGRWTVRLYCRAGPEARSARIEVKAVAAGDERYHQESDSNSRESLDRIKGVVSRGEKKGC